MNFRKDINGLRAIAVLGVVFFHFIPTAIPGGFAGVDVFFVISGYLMSGIIFKSIENNNFSIFKFYIARANRIVPALAVLCLFLLVFGWLYLTPMEFKKLGKDIASSTTFLSNIVYWRESGYFDSSSHSKWLLHTWSLSVEWQFYIIFPLFIVAVKRFISFSSIKYLMLAITILSFIFSVIATYQWPNASYYLLPTRAWEMLIGSIVYLFPLSLSERSKVYFEALGGSLIILSYFIVSSENYWPGYLALLPVLGAALLLQSQRKSSFLTGNVLFQRIGLRSYSIYLWHWPLVVAIYYFSLPGEYIFWGVLLSFFFGELSYRYVESVKLSNEFNGFLDLLKFKPIYMVLVIFLIGCGYNKYWFIKFGNLDVSIYSRFEEATSDWEYPGINQNINDYPIRYIDVGGDKENLFVGDSLMEQFYPKIKAMSELLETEDNSVFYTMGGCTPFYNLEKKIDNKERNCKQLRKVNNYIYEHNFNNIFVSGMWDAYMIKGLGDFKPFELELLEKEMVDFFLLSKKKSNNVYYILPMPYGDMYDPKKMSKLFYTNSLVTKYPISVFKIKYRDFYLFMNRVSKETGIILIDPLDSVCSDFCYTTDKNSNPLYIDDTHGRASYIKENIIFFDGLL